MRKLASEILSNPPFDAWDDSLAITLHRLLEWLSSFVPWLQKLYVASPGLYWLLLAGLLAVALLLIAHIVWSTRVALRSQAPQQQQSTAETRPLWSKEASDLASQGRYLEAAHRLALGSIQLLVAGGHIELDRSEPNRVLRKRVLSAGLPREFASEFLRQLDSFEAHWFRDRSEDPGLYEAWRSLHSQISALRAHER